LNLEFLFNNSVKVLIMHHSGEQSCEDVKYTSTVKYTMFGENFEKYGYSSLANVRVAPDYIL
jgi:hypothetical protein